MYGNHSFKVKKDGAVAKESTSTTRGLKQGCPLSPILFNIVLEHVLLQIDFGNGIKFLKRERTPTLDKQKQKKGKGRGRPESRNLTHLLFADDIVVCAESHEGLQRLLQLIADIFVNYGLTVNKKKTKWQKDDNTRMSTSDQSLTKNERKRKTKTLRRKRMLRRKKILPEKEEEEDKQKAEEREKEKITIDGVVIERVEKFIYLGSCFNENDDDADDIDRRLQQGNAALARINKLLWSNNIPRKLKKKMVMVFVYPSATYGCETWTLSTEAKTHLNAWWMRLMRRIRGVTKEDKLRSASILKELNASRLSDMIEERQLRYAGHVWRYDDNRWTKFMLQAERPSQKNGKQQQYRKHLTKLLKEKNLETSMMMNSETWANKLRELYPTCPFIGKTTCSFSKTTCPFIGKND